MDRGSVRTKHIDFILVDIISVIFSFIIAYLIRIDRSDDADLLTKYRMIAGFVVVIYLIVLLFNGFHSDILRRGLLRELWNVILVNLYILFVLLAVLFALKVSEEYSRLVFGFFVVIDVFVMLMLRTARKYWIIDGYRKGKNVSNAVIVTYRDTLRDFVGELKRENTGFYNYIGVCLLDDKADGETISVKGLELDNISRDNLLDYVRDNAVNDAFILAGARDNSNFANRFLMMGISVYLGMNLEMGEMTNANIEKIGKYTILTTSIRTGTFGELFVKRVFDIFVGFVGVFFTGLLYLIFAPIIKIQSPGPAFFSQDRVGKNGKIFKLYKFRSMYMDAEERKKELMDQNQMSGLMFKMDNDPRITPIGRFIRKTSIDEFPQFWNILKGDMSFVGTRPPTVDEYKQYNPHHLSRLAIKPGLTGMWQTSGRSEITDFEEVVRLDNEYIKNFSLLMDLKIILRTFKTVFTMKGSV